jgi:hypothetical protein
MMIQIRLVRIAAWLVFTAIFAGSVLAEEQDVEFQENSLPLFDGRSLVGWEGTLTGFASKTKRLLRDA